MGAKFASYDDKGTITGLYDSESHPVPNGANFIELTHEQWLSCVSIAGHQVIDGRLIQPLAPSAEKIKSKLKAILALKIKKALDAGAEAWGYETMLSALSYENSTVEQFAADAKKLRLWRDAVWLWGIDALNAVDEKTVLEEVLAAMPMQPNQPSA